MSQGGIPGVVQFDDGRLLTRNLAPGVRVYDEELHTVNGEEHRTWNPTRSKLGAYIVKGGRYVPLHERSTVLYLGAANGTTPSHVSDIVRDGLLVAVEFSPRSFRDLLRVSGQRPNMVPVLADAWRPELYERYLGKVDLLFQDIAQRQQAAIFAKNINRFKPAWAMLAIKARSVDVAAHPRQVYENVSREVSELTGYEVVDMIDLGPYEKDHAAIVLRPGTGERKAAPRAEPREERREERPRGFGAREERPRGGGGYGAPREERPRGGYGGREERGPPPRRDDRGDERPRGFGPKGGGPPPGGAGGPRKFDKKPYDKGDRPGGFENRRKWK